MPSIAKQSPPPVATNHVQPQTLTAPGITSAKSLKRSWMKVLIYGRSRVGKSTLSSQWPKPLCAVACEPRENGGADSLIGMDGVDICVVGLKPLSGEMSGGTVKILDQVQRWRADVDATGKCPYQTLTLDVTALQDIVLAEIMGWESMDTIIKRPKRGESGGVGFPQYMERAVRTQEILRKFTALPCHCIFLAQEKDHNPAKDGDGNAVGGKLVRAAQERSFMAASLGQGTVEWLQNACQFVMQLYMDDESREDTTMVDVGGVMTPQTIVTITGKRIRRLRTSYHTNYSAGITVPGLLTPEYIESNDPREMYEDLMRVASGQRALRGKYA